MSDVKGMYIGGSPTYFKDETAREFISDIYDETKTYTVDSYCIHENKLYKCTTETTGGFDGSCWKETNMTTEAAELSAAVSEQNKNFAWKEVANIAQVPSTANEVIIQISLASSNGEFTYNEELRYLYRNVLKGIRKIIAGFYWDTSICGYADVTITSDSITVEPKKYYTQYRIDSIYYR